MVCANDELSLEVLAIHQQNEHTQCLPVGNGWPWNNTRSDVRKMVIVRWFRLMLLWLGLIIGDITPFFTPKTSKVRLDAWEAG